MLKDQKKKNLKRFVIVQAALWIAILLLSPYPMEAIISVLGLNEIQLRQDISCGPVPAGAICSRPPYYPLGFLVEDISALIMWALISVSFIYAVIFMVRMIKKRKSTDA